MVPPSNPQLMTRVLDTISNLRDEKGSYTRDILDFLRRSYTSPPRNLTMQVRRALNHAVNAGILRHQSGRYKVLFTLNSPTGKPSTQKSNSPKPGSGVQNGPEKSGEKSVTTNKPSRQRKEVAGKKKGRGSKRGRDRSRERKRKRQESQSQRRTQRKSKNEKDEDPVRRKGREIWRRRKKHNTEVITPKKDEQPKDSDQHSYCSDSCDEYDYVREQAAKKRKQEQRDRQTPAPSRGRSQQSRITSKERSLSRGPDTDTENLQLIESQPHIPLEVNNSLENTQEPTTDNEDQERMNDDMEINQGIDQDFEANKSRSGSTL